MTVLLFISVSSSILSKCRPLTKIQHILDAIEFLLSAWSISISALESKLGCFGKYVFRAQSKKTFVSGKFSLNYGLQFRRYDPTERLTILQQMQAVSKELNMYSKDTFYPKRSQQSIISNILMNTVLHAFHLWHELLRNELIRLCCNNVIVVDATNKHSYQRGNG